MDIIVTGASGFVGKRLVVALQRIKGVNVIPVSRRKNNFPGAVILENYRDLPSGDAIVHLAENPDRSAVNKLSRSAISSSVSSLERIVNKGFENIVYTSSSVVYGDNGSAPYVVSQPVIASDIYSESKLACEKIVTSVSGEIVARLSNLYGPGMSSKNVISDILCQLPCNGSIMIRDELPIRDFLWIDDAVELLSKMAVIRRKRYI